MDRFEAVGIDGTESRQVSFLEERDDAASVRSSEGGRAGRGGQGGAAAAAAASASAGQQAGYSSLARRATTALGIPTDRDTDIPVSELSKRVDAFASRDAQLQRLLGAGTAGERTAPLLVIEYRRGWVTARYRNMRRHELLVECRRAVEVAGEAPAVPAAAAAAAASSGPGTGSGAAPLQSRDLRVLDADFEASSEPAVLIRKGCVVLNLPSAARAIVLADRCYFLPPQGADAELVPVLERFQRLGTRAAAAMSAGSVGEGQGQGQAAAAAVPPPFSLPSRAASDVSIPETAAGLDDAGGDAAASAAAEQDVPFAFYVLETLLLCVVSALNRHFDADNDAAQAIITKLLSTRGVGALPIYERMRALKRRLHDLISRVKATHRVLAELLDTPADLRALALTAARDAPPGLLLPQPQLGEAGQLAGSKPGIRSATTAAKGGAGAGEPFALAPAAVAALHAPLPRAMSSAAGSVVVEGIPLADYADAAEVLVESYVSQLESLLSRCKLLREDLISTEEDVNLSLATNRNQLLRAEVSMTIGTLCTTACAVVSSYFGMNLHNNQEDSFGTFLAVTLGTTAAAAVLGLLLAAYVRTILK